MIKLTSLPKTAPLGSAILILTCLIFSSLSYAEGRSYSGWQSKGWEVSGAPSPLHGCLRYCDLIEAASRRHGVSPKLIVAVITQESRFKPDAVSPKGAKGLMQLMPVNYQGIDPFQPKLNIERGTRLLARLLEKYQDTALALAAYNAGEGNVKKYKGIPPFKETQNYVRRVMAHYNQMTG
ncbi:lytic transglycosylase domain-containing protein [Vibrio sp. 10N.261.46.A3]|uniref:lytic transglycosylase domain-containing protein n=1 Tax=Vibrio sp. 10N.261.46.A3 TaxID=3229658 RepID=UPI0035515223